MLSNEISCCGLIKRTAWASMFPPISSRIKTAFPLKTASRRSRNPPTRNPLKSASPSELLKLALLNSTLPSTAASTRFKIAAKSEPLKDRFLRKRSEEHTSELQSHHDLVCRLLLEKKKK